MVDDEQHLKAVKKFLKNNEGSVLVLGKHLKRYKGSKKIPITKEQLPELVTTLSREADQGLLEELTTFTNVYVDIYGVSEPQPMTSTLYTRNDNGTLSADMRKRAATISHSLGALEEKLRKNYHPALSCEPNTLDRIADKNINIRIMYDNKADEYVFTLYRPRSTEKGGAIEARTVLGGFRKRKLKEGLRTINNSDISDLTLDLLITGLSVPNGNYHDNGNKRPQKDDVPIHPAASEAVMELYLLGMNNEQNTNAVIKASGLRSMRPLIDEAYSAADNR